MNGEKLSSFEMEEVMPDVLVSALLHDRCVYVRTPRGQRSAAGDSGLSDTEKSFLLLVNGHTQLRILIDRLPPSSDFAQSVENLHKLGLIELVGPMVTKDTEHQISSWSHLDASDERSA